ncbi:MAG: ATP-binding protein [Candidatus Margulisbacteria bacterium]|nr:ATP-binding protein [Candidatus Margulisiibacteriota bacterium]
MSFYDGSLLFTAVTSAALGLFVYSQDRHKAPNITLGLLSAAIGAWCFGQFMGAINTSKEVVLFWTRANIAAAIFIPVFYFHFVLAFINRLKENLPGLGLAYLSAGILLLLDLTPWFVADIAPRLNYRFYPVAGIVYPFFSLYLLTLIIVAFVQQLVFLKNSSGAAANQMKYVLIASIVGFAGGLTAFFPVYNINLPVVSQFALPVYLAIIVYAIVKHKLLDVNLVIRAGLVYSALTVLFAGFYALAILSTNRLFQNLASFNEYGATILVVFVSVLVFQPLRDRIQSAVDRLFFRGDYYYQKTINDLSIENLKLYGGLLQADKLSALGTIAAGMAHEIKNPLASIKGLTQVLPENLEDPEFIRKYSEIVPRQLDRINRIVEDLLDFGHPAGMVMQAVDVEEVLEDILRLVENQCRKANIEIVRDFQKQSLITGNAEKLSQAFMNIILNAIQAMPGGGFLKLKTYNLPLTTVIEIADTGAGIPAGKLSNIFDPFYTTKESGTGMGLAVTHRIIKEHNGTIEVASEVGKGTTFKLCLPIRQEPSV